MPGDGQTFEANDPERDQPARRPRWASLFNFTARGHTANLVIAVAFAVVSGVVIPAVAIFLGRLFNLFTDFGGNQISGQDLVRKVTVNCLAIAGVGAGSWVLNGGFFMFWLVFGELQAKTVRDKLFDGLMGRDMEWYDLRKNGIGALIPRLQSQIRELQMATSQPLGFLVQYTVTAVAALGVAFYHSWKLTLVIIATFPVAAIVLAYTSSKMQPAINAQEDSLAAAAKGSSSAIAAIETVKCFNGEDGEIRQYSIEIHKAAQNYSWQAHFSAIQIGIIRLVTLGMFVQGFWYGSTLIGPGKTKPGDVLTTFWAALMATQAIEQILPQMIVLEKGRAAGATLQAVRLRVERGRRIMEMAGSLSPAQCKGDVNLRRVSFSYPSRPDVPALDKATMFFPAGEITFVVGGSGSGKSTLGSLIMRYYSSWTGEISIDDAPLQTLDLRWLRGNVTLVQQESILFDETLFQNIAFGRRDYDQVTKAEVKRACQVALLQRTINDLTDGLDTLVGTGGKSLSGGQRQRVALARARLRDTPILILDEPTSALDYTSRSLVMDAIREWRKGKTTIVVTHDLSQIYEDDFVYVLDKGRVVQEGYKSALEKDKAGLLSSLLKNRTDSVSHAAERKIQDPFKSRVALRSQSDAGILSGRRSSVESVDSLELEFPRNVHYIRSTSINSATALNERRPSLSQLSPLTPLSSPLSPRLQGPLGMELVELSGRATREGRMAGAGRLDAIRSTPRAVHPTFASVGNPGSGRSPFDLCSRRKKRKRQAAQEDGIASLKQILSTLWPNLNTRGRLLLIFGFLCALLHAAATPVFSFLFAKLLGTFFVTEGRSRQAMKWSLSVLGVAVVDAVASYCMHYLLEACGQIWIDRIRIEALRRILEQPRAWFDEETSSVSRLSECLDRNAEEMRNLVGRFAGFVFVALAMTSMAIIWSFVICWKLTLVGIASAPVMYGVTAGFEFVSGKWEGRSNDAAEAAGAIFMETFSNIRVVRALTLEKYFRDKYEKATRSAFNIGLKRSAYSGLFYGLSDSLILFITALIFFYGAKLVSSGEFTTSDILTVFTMLTFSIANANSIVSFIPQINSSRDTATRLLRLAQLPRTSHEKGGFRKIDTLLPIRLRNLSFAYPARPNQRVLNRINLEITANSSIAVVGASGSGKSTLASLLVGLYPVSADSSLSPLTYNGVPVAEVDLRYLRAQIAVVPQQPVLFPATIAANIAYGLASKGVLGKPSSNVARRGSNESITTDTVAIWDAAKRAGIHDFIVSLPQSYGTVIGDGGQGLSGGQAQRIAIARALVRKPRLLILDEATSSLDTENAKLIRDTIRGLIAPRRRRDPGPSSPFATSSSSNNNSRDNDDGDGGNGMAVLIIPHAKEMMKMAEKIVVLDQGRIIEEGSWQELMSPGNSKKAGRGALRKLLSGGEWMGGDANPDGGNDIGIGGGSSGVGGGGGGGSGGSDTRIEENHGEGSSTGPRRGKGKRPVFGDVVWDKD